jgi:hypothetical protein
MRSSPGVVEDISKTRMIPKGTDCSPLLTEVLFNKPSNFYLKFQKRIGRMAEKLEGGRGPWR